MGRAVFVGHPIAIVVDAVVASFFARCDRPDALTELPAEFAVFDASLRPSQTSPHAGQLRVTFVALHRFTDSASQFAGICLFARV
jgi:hypothetical protein